MKRLFGKGKILITYISVFSIMAASVLSAVAGINFGTVAADPNTSIEIWGGSSDTTKLTEYAAGHGTSVDPYIIENGDQLFRMVYDHGLRGSEPAYYKLAKDIYLNDISNYDSWTDSGFDFSALNNWGANGLHTTNGNIATGIDRTFKGHIDGDGYTIYGMYCYVEAATDDSGGAPAALIQCADGATIKNLTMSHFYAKSGCSLNNDNDTIAFGSAAAFVGRFVINGTSMIKFSNCASVNGYLDGTYMGGLVGSRCNQPFEVSNCLVADLEFEKTNYKSYGGILAHSWGSGHNVNGFISLGVHPTGSNFNTASPWAGIIFTDTYTDTDAHADAGAYAENADYLKFMATVKKLTTAQLTAGSNIDRMLVNIDWENWTTGETYPIPDKEKIIPKGEDYVYSGTGSDDWAGNASKTYAGGSGTVDDPWIIENCEQFYLMVSTTSAKEYYKVADGLTDLYFNDVKNMTYAQAKAYLSGGSSSVKIYNPGSANKFNGYFDGNGVTLHGIYMSSADNAGVFPNLGSNPTIKNFTVKNSYFTTDSDNPNAACGAVVGLFSDNNSPTIRNIAVLDCYLSGTGSVAGIVANSGYGTNAIIKNCLVAGCELTTSRADLLGGIIAEGSTTGLRTITDCISIGYYPTGYSESNYAISSTSINNVYTDTETTSSYVSDAHGSGVSVFVTAALKGTAVQSTANFDWDTDWQTTSSYPMPRIYKTVSGTVGAVWSKLPADTFAGGNGTETNPFIIDTAERFVYMMETAREGLYYALSEDIYLNDVSAADWYNGTDINSWFTSSDVPVFLGKLDGDSHTLYGLYVNNVPSGASAGLFPVLGSSANVRNLTIANAYLSGNAGSNIGTVAGSVVDNAQVSVAIRGCDILDSVILNGGGNVGGILGLLGVSAVRIENSAFKGNIQGDCTVKGGLLAVSNGAATLKSSFSTGIYALGDDSGFAIKNIYSNVSQSESVGGKNADVTVLTDEQMKGTNAKTYMSALDFAGGVWQTVTDGYPVIVGKVIPSDGVVGEVWSGDCAQNYAGGSGTPEDPYLIETGEQLYKMIIENINYNDPIESFKLTADIKLNDITSDFWAARVGLNSWITGKTNVPFRGNFDGDGYVVYGLYVNDTTTSGKGTSVGLIPTFGQDCTLKNVGVSHAYLSQNLNGIADIATGGLVGQIYPWNYGNYATSADQTADFTYDGKKLPVISNCFVDNTCYIEAPHSAGGMVGIAHGPFVIENCYSTATIYSKRNAGSIIGAAYGSYGTHIINCFASTQGADSYVSGTLGATDGGGHKSTNVVFNIKGTYGFSLYSMYLVNSLKYAAQRLGKENYDIVARTEANPDGFDFENVWEMVEDGTPVLQIFNKPSHAASEFSDKTFEAPKVTVTLQTGTTDVVLDPMVGQMYDPFELPIPVRKGYNFLGWYVYPEYQCEYTYGYFPARDLSLYAKWEQVAIIQNFESYPDTTYDTDKVSWICNKPGAKGGYKIQYAHGGSKSMHRVANDVAEADCLLNYKEYLNIGQKYEISFWVTTDATGSDAELSLVHNSYPDYLNTAVGIEKMVAANDLTDGVWQQYSYTFTAKTHWVSLRATSASLYFDDIMINPIGEILPDKGLTFVSSPNGSITTTPTTTSPSTSDNATPIMILVCAITACAVVLVVSKKGLVEVIEK